MRVHIAAAVVLALAVAACSSSPAHPSPSPTASPDPWAALLARPLQLPSATNACLPADQRTVSPDFGPALGDGPLYPVGFTDGVLSVGTFPSGGDWLGNKVLWVAPPGFTGKALIRGARIDGQGDIAFGDSPFPNSDLRLEPYSTGGWYNWPSYTRVKSPGCYAYQVDTADFSYTITFEATEVQ